MCVSSSFYLDQHLLLKSGALTLMSSLEATARAMVDFYKKMNGEIKNLDMLPADQKNLSNNANIRPNKNSKLETNDTKPQSSSLKKSLPIS